MRPFRKTCALLCLWLLMVNPLLLYTIFVSSCIILPLEWHKLTLIKTHIKTHFCKTLSNFCAKLATFQHEPAAKGFKWDFRVYWAVQGFESDAKRAHKTTIGKGNGHVVYHFCKTLSTFHSKTSSHWVVYQCCIGLVLCDHTNLTCDNPPTTISSSSLATGKANPTIPYKPITRAVTVRPSTFIFIKCATEGSDSWKL